MTDSYSKVSAYLRSCPDLSKGAGATDQEIRALTNIWGPVPEDFAAYLRDFGWVRFGAQEVLGLGRDVEPHLNLLKRARRLWDGDGIYRLPSELLPVYDSGGGWFYCLSKIHPGQPVVCWAHEHEELHEPQPYDELFPTWSDWFLSHLVTNQLPDR